MRSTTLGPFGFWQIAVDFDERSPFRKYFKADVCDAEFRRIP
jgi:hypothetical protein